MLSENNQILSFDVPQARQLGSKPIAPSDQRAICIAPDAETFIVRDNKPGGLSFGNVDNPAPLMSVAPGLQGLTGYVAPATADISRRTWANSSASLTRKAAK